MYTGSEAGDRLSGGFVGLMDSGRDIARQIIERM